MLRENVTQKTEAVTAVSRNGAPINNNNKV